MALINTTTDTKADLVNKKFGRPNGFGSISLGESWLGDDTPAAGIYKIISIRPPWRESITSKANKTINIKTEFYMQLKPRTANQQACALKFKNGMTAWKALTEEQQAVYNQNAKKLRMQGKNLYMREWMSL